MDNFVDELLIRMWVGDGTWGDFGVIVNRSAYTIRALEVLKKMHRMLCVSLSIDDAISILQQNGYALKDDETTANCKGIIIKDPENYNIESVDLSLTNGEYSLNVYDTLWTADAKKRVQENGGTFLKKEFPIRGNARDIDKAIEYLKNHEDDAFEGDGFFPYAFVRKEEFPE
jgi:hypothetical protein